MGNPFAYQNSWQSPLISSGQAWNETSRQPANFPPTPPASASSDVGSKALLNGLKHQVTDHLTADATCAGTPGNDLSVTGIQRKGDSHNLIVPAGDLKAIRCPAQIGADRYDLAVVSPTWRLFGISLQRKRSLDDVLTQGRA
jgi:hypothetical protein